MGKQILFISSSCSEQLKSYFSSKHGKNENFGKQFEFFRFTSECMPACNGFETAVCGFERLEYQRYGKKQEVEEGLLTRDCRVKIGK